MRRDTDREESRAGEEAWNVIYLSLLACEDAAWKECV